MIKIKSGLFVVAVMTSLMATADPVNAFEITTPPDGATVFAGSRLKVRVDPGDIPILFGVVLTSAPGVIKPKFDPLMPFEWEITIPAHYYGPLTLMAIGRRYIPIPNPPHAEITIDVVYPAITVGAP